MTRSPRPEHLLAAMLSATEDAIISFALDGTIQTWSRGAESLYGFSEAEISGQSLTRLIPLYEIPLHQELLRRAQKGDLACPENTERLHKDGSKVRVATKRATIRAEDGTIAGILESSRKLSWSAQGTVAEAPLRLLVEQMPAVLWTTDRKLRITSNWGSGSRLGKFRPGELVGRTVHEFLKCQDPHAVAVLLHYEALRGVSSQFEFIRDKCVLEIRLEPLREASGEIVGCLGAGIDITERKKNEDEVRYLATHDALTGLANYREFLEKLEHEVRRAERSQQRFAVLLLDLDELKLINDKLGHLAGNQALKRLAAAMKGQCRSTDVAARYGGDEFAALLIDADREMAQQIAERVKNALRSDNEEPRLSVSIGISAYPADGPTAHELLEAADQQLYDRKRKARKAVSSAMARQ